MTKLGITHDAGGAAVDKKLRLFEVTISTTALVLAESAAEARNIRNIRNIRDTEDFVDVEVAPASFTTTGAPCYPRRWDGRSLVYGADDDVTAAEAFDIEEKARGGK